MRCGRAGVGRRDRQTDQGAGRAAVAARRAREQNACADARESLLFDAGAHLCAFSTAYFHIFYISPAIALRLGTFGFGGFSSRGRRRVRVRFTNHLSNRWPLTSGCVVAVLLLGLNLPANTARAANTADVLRKAEAARQAQLARQQAEKRAKEQAELQRLAEQARREAAARAQKEAEAKREAERKAREAQQKAKGAPKAASGNPVAPRPASSSPAQARPPEAVKQSLQARPPEVVQRHQEARELRRAQEAAAIKQREAELEKQRLAELLAQRKAQLERQRLIDLDNQKEAARARLRAASAPNLNPLPSNDSALKQVTQVSAPINPPPTPPVTSARAPGAMRIGAPLPKDKDDDANSSDKKDAVAVKDSDRSKGCRNAKNCDPSDRCTVSVGAAEGGGDSSACRAPEKNEILARGLSDAHASSCSRAVTRSAACRAALRVWQCRRVSIHAPR